MKTPLLFLLLFTTIAYAQNEKCEYYCHNGKVIKALNENSIKGHIKHGDAFVGTCDDNVNVGGACDVLTAPDFDFKMPLPIGNKYFIIDIIGRVRQQGKVSSTFYDEIPKGEIFYIKIKGYKLKKIYIKKE